MVLLLLILLIAEQLRTWRDEPERRSRYQDGRQPQRPPNPFQIHVQIGHSLEMPVLNSPRGPTTTDKPTAFLPPPLFSSGSLQPESAQSNISSGLSTNNVPTAPPNARLSSRGRRLPESPPPSYSEGVGAPNLRQPEERPESNTQTDQHASTGSGRGSSPRAPSPDLIPLGRRNIEDVPLRRHGALRVPPWARNWAQRPEQTHPGLLNLSRMPLRGG
jgi:hypothetical protein